MPKEHMKNGKKIRTAFIIAIDAAYLVILLLSVLNILDIDIEHVTSIGAALGVAQVSCDLYITHRQENRQI